MGGLNLGCVVFGGIAGELYIPLVVQTRNARILNHELQLVAEVVEGLDAETEQVALVNTESGVHNTLGGCDIGPNAKTFVNHLLVDKCKYVLVISSAYIQPAFEVTVVGGVIRIVVHVVQAPRAIFADRLADGKQAEVASIEVAKLSFATGGKNARLITPYINNATNASASEVLGAEPEVSGNDIAFRNDERFGRGRAIESEACRLLAEFEFCFAGRVPSHICIGQAQVKVVPVVDTVNVQVHFAVQHYVALNALFEAYAETAPSQVVVRLVLPIEMVGVSLQTTGKAQFFHYWSVPNFVVVNRICQNLGPCCNAREHSARSKLQREVLSHCCRYWIVITEKA